MTKFIALLRGINVGGQKKVKSEDLKKTFESLGFKNVITYIQSGNVVFDCLNCSSNKIENKLKEVFNFEVKVLIRTKEEFKKIIDNNPFKEKERTYVIFLSETPKNIPIDEINKVKEKNEEFFINSKEIYLLLPNYGRTKLNNNFFEGKLKVNGTTRNFNTVTKLFEMVS